MAVVLLVATDGGGLLPILVGDGVGVVVNPGGVTGLVTRSCLSGSYARQGALAGAYSVATALAGAYDRSAALAGQYANRADMAGAYDRRTSLAGELETC